MLRYVFLTYITRYEAYVFQDFELFDELCNEKRFIKQPAGGLGELRHGLGDGLFTARFGEHNWEVAHRVLVPVFGPLAISKMFDGTDPSHSFLGRLTLLSTLLSSAHLLA